VSAWLPTNLNLAIVVGSGGRTSILLLLLALAYLLLLVSVIESWKQLLLSLPFKLLVHSISAIQFFSSLSHE
jgi:hypothetical protein